MAHAFKESYQTKIVNSRGEPINVDVADFEIVARIGSVVVANLKVFVQEVAMNDKEQKLVLIHRDKPADPQPRRGREFL